MEINVEKSEGSRQGTREFEKKRVEEVEEGFEKRIYKLCVINSNFRP